MKLRFWFLLPSRIWMVALFAAPFAIVLAYSFLTRGTYGGVEKPWTIEAYQRLADPLYLTILLRSFLMALAATVLCLVFAFPAALFISRATRHKNLYLQLVMLPFWTSFLVRTYAWLFLLRDTGLINMTLQSLGIIHAPLQLLYNDGAVLLGLVYGYLPFMVLPIYATLERMDPSLIEAAADLGARPIATLFRVIVPLSRPGIVAGSVLVFIPCLGAYLTPDLLGGGRTVLVGNLVQNQFTNARDWPFGSAVSMLLMALVTLLVWGLLRRESEQLG
ncbi:MAG: ABC transporter permease [Acidobacteria bacterium]|jgi:spermidine/putrescine transport system permease protein|nr:ABC transporter permease [Acidobacteriota bacterium]